MSAPLHIALTAEPRLNTPDTHLHRRPRIILDPTFRRVDELFSPTDLRRLHGLVDVVWGRDEPMPIDAVRAELRDAMAIVCASWRYGELPNDATSLRAIIDVSGRFPDHLNYTDCFTRGVRVLSAAPGFGPQVAEMALGLALAATREIVIGDRHMRQGTEDWQHAGNATTTLLYGKHVGFIGFGSIGRSLLPLLEPFGCAISVYDPWLGTGYLRSSGVEPVTLTALVDSSEVIFVLAAPSSENRALLNREILERIKPGSVLVLISRAHVVDFTALTELVTAGRFKAAIDVFPTEPLAPDHPVRNAPMAVLSAHRAGSVREGMWTLGELIVDDLEALARRLPPQRLQSATPELVQRLTGPNTAGPGPA